MSVRRLATAVRTTWQRHPALFAWLVMSVLWVAYIISVYPSIGWVDSNVGPDEFAYLVEIQKLESPISLEGYDGYFRGVVFAWVPRQILWIASLVGVDPEVALQPWVSGVMNSVAIPVVTTLVPGSIILSLTGRRVPFVRLVAFNLAFFLFWRNDAVRLLTDIPAVALLASSIAILVAPWARAASRSAQLALHAAAGLMLGCAFNLRPAYLLPVMIAAVTLPWISLGPGRARRVVAVGIGIAITLAGQSLGNAAAGQTPIPVAPGSLDIASGQLELGLRYQRYDSYVGPTPGYPPSRMFFDNTRNLGGLDHRTVTSFGSFAAAAIRHPLPAAESIARHTFNGLDLRQSGTYVEDVHSPVVPLQVVNFAMVFSAISVLVIRARRSQNDAGGVRSWLRTFGDPQVRPRVWITGLVLAMAAQASLTAVETRFFLPVWLVLVAVLLLTATIADVPRRPSARIGLAVGIVLAVGLSVAASSFVAESLIDPIPTPSTASPP